jgi:alpha-galactosidase
MGAHIGPGVCHITGRILSMETRAGVAMFGHMGIEANLLEIDDDQTETLKAGVSLHKKHRQLIHSGNLVRLNTQCNENGFGIIAQDGGEALFSYAQLDSLSNSVSGRLQFVGLDSNRFYQVSIVWPQEPTSYSTSILDVINGSVISGEALTKAGIQLPIMHPASLLVFHLIRR